MVNPALRMDCVVLWTFIFSHFRIHT